MCRLSDIGDVLYCILLIYPRMHQKRQKLMNRTLKQQNAITCENDEHKKKLRSATNAHNVLLGEHKYV